MLLPTKRKPLPKRIKAATDPAPPAWPSYTGTSQYVGTSKNGRVVVFFDPTLGDPGCQNATDLVADADRIVAANDALFGTSSGSVSVIVFALGGMTDGTGGADHMGCDYVTGNAIEVCAAFGQSARVSALFEAELSECAMNNNLCGLSTGEALSRWCAMVVGGNALSDFATAPTWVADGSQNFVDTTDPTDQNPDSTGCGMAFISWLQAPFFETEEIGFPLAEIAQVMVNLGNAGTLAQLYSTLTGDAASNAWTKFQAALAALPFGVTTDDPFAGAQPVPQPGPTPPPGPPTPGTGVTLAQAQAWAAQGLAENWPA